MKKLVWILVFTFGINVTAQKAVLSNFRIENSYKNRVYFDVKGDISGLTKQGFVISGKSISSINTSGNYFTVTSSFNFWDNNTIRLGENSDSSDVNTKVHNFTLSYIINSILEPEANTYRYVTTDANGGGDGKSEATAWTLKEAASNAVAGMTIWIKAGDYGSIQNWTINKSGTASNPIKYIGYKSSIEDITSNYFDYGITMDSSEMPTFNGGDTSKYHMAIQTNGSYFILRNIQTSQYYRSFYTTGTPNNFILDRFNIKDNYHPTESGPSGIYIRTSNPHHIRVKNSITVNCSMHGTFIQDENAEFNLFDNIKSYNNQVGAKERQDYHISINGQNSIIRNCYAENFNNTETNGSTHGIGIRGAGHPNNNYNLIEKSTGVNCQENFYIRNNSCSYNVIKDCSALNNSTTQSYEDCGGLWLWGGVHYNIYERCTVKGMTYCGIGLKDNNEEVSGGADDIGSNNIVRNCTFENVKYAVLGTCDDPASFRDGKFYNNTFNNANYFYKNKENTTITGLEVNNNIFNNVSSNLGGIPGMIFKNNNFFNSWTSSLGSNAMNVDPKFKNVTGGNFRLEADSPLINKGKNLNEVQYDFDGNFRPQGSSTDIGAFEYQENTVGSVEASAGSDQAICLGESVTLTAAGGSAYSWNTGATTKSITVSPGETTTYTVTVSEGSSSDSDTVTVAVSSVTAGAGGNQTITAGESVTLTASGGDSYVWNTGATTKSITVSPTATTTYTVTAKQGDCEDTDSVKVTVNTAATVTADAGSDQAICLGESVTLTAAGGSAYSWNTGATTKSITVNPNETTTYTVTVSEGSSSDSDAVTVAVSSVTANAGADKTITAGESVTLTASGGDSYVWNTGETTKSITVTPTATTTYTVTAKQGSCEDTDSVKVTVNAAATVTANAGSDQAICLGESVTLTASGGASYSWNTGATTKSITVNPNETTTYSVTVTEGSASDSDSVQVTVNSVTAGAGGNQTITSGESNYYLYSNSKTRVL